MSRTNVSRCTIPTKRDSDSLYVKVKNNNENFSRQFSINVYNTATNELLSVYEDDKLILTDTLEPGVQKAYKVDVSSVDGKVLFEIIQKSGGSGIKVSRNSKNPSTVELQIK